MKKSLILGVVLFLGATQIFAYTIYQKNSWGYSIKCNNGAIKGVKQKSNGKWKETGYFDQNFDTMDEAARFACGE